ncbi:hypothetical protein CFP56_009613 [Quercus suber]|uniref:Subtilisin n=1 Tax=Quercus suber TaxID=58331 RepID=A0AAW0M5S5_QUESU
MSYFGIWVEQTPAWVHKEPFNSFLNQVVNIPSVRPEHESNASVVEDTVHHLHTTRSWNLWEIVVSFFSKDNRHDVIVGHLDGGNKLIGSQCYHDGFLDQIGPPESFGTVYRPPCNDFGHDTHTTSKAV